MLRMTFARCLAVALIVGSSLLAPTAWAAGKVQPQAPAKPAAAVQAGPMGALWTWLHGLLGKAPMVHAPIRPDAGGCIEPDGHCAI
jgi:hypothetical protein